MFEHGELQASQQLAAAFARRYRSAGLPWTARFRVLEAESAAWRGLNQDVLTALAFPSGPSGPTNWSAASTDAGLQIRRAALLGVAYAHLHQFDLARQELSQGEAICSANLRAECSELLRASAGLAIEQGRSEDAYKIYAQSLALARRFACPFDEAAALMNLGGTSLFDERFDEAIGWLLAANRVAAREEAGEILMNDAGNLGWAYFKLGDSERALSLMEAAGKRAEELGDIDGAVTWLTNAGLVYQDARQLSRAEAAYRHSLDLAQQVNNREAIVNSLEDLAHVSIEAGKLEQAGAYLRQLTPLVGENANPLDALDLLFAQGKIDAAEGRREQAESIFTRIQQDPASQASMRIGAGHALALLLEQEGKTAAADGMFRNTLAAFEAARAQLKNEDSKLPYLANATPVYDDYIALLIRQGKADRALALADQSRARTLEQGLGMTDRPGASESLLRPQAIAARTRATLLFYWLGEKQSWLWAVTPSQTRLFPLPARSQIEPLVARYRRALLGPSDPIQSGDPDGPALYRILIQPAREILKPNARMILLSDGALSELNFETLPVPGSETTSGASAYAGSQPARAHYWIEDAAVISAPSLHVLASARPARIAARRLLLVGDAVSPGEEYPELPEAGLEVKKVRAHFAAADQTVYTRQQATATAYLQSAPGKFSYIHFVAHGVASRTDPLDSAIILSRAGARSAGEENSFKLYAREILKHPIDARLVTISACYGSGTRSYAGEGLVGLSWAFLHAGAHNVIGTLWEVSDDSTPRLMDGLYKGLEDGLDPGIALRQAKLNLLHSGGAFQRPFFWAPFQLYAGM